MLSSMYNKIELAYAMGEINDAIRNDLLVLSKLRNLLLIRERTRAFAFSRGEIDTEDL